MATAVHTTTCYMCACRCGVDVTVADGRVRFIQGHRDHPVNRGVICAKGSAGIMKQYSPAKLRQPLMRRPGAERGEGDLVPISWEEALDVLTARLRRIRSTDPKTLAFFTGRDQMQALTGLWAQQFGTPNWAAHGGFCSVNMAAAGLYSIGYSFWEFGAPDWERAKYFLMWGVAEDHSSNPIKLGLERLKSNGAKFVSVNPVRTGYSAIADEWIPVRPGTDGLLALSMAHVLLKRGLIDQEFLVRYTNAPWLVGEDGLFVRDGKGNPQVWDQKTQSQKNALEIGTAPSLLHDKSVFSLALKRYLGDEYSPERVAKRCGVDAATIERIALEMAHVAFNEAIELPIRWTDVYGRTHDKVIGRPVAMYAMRGVSAHANGFQSCRALHLLQMLLGVLEGPGNFRARAPYPRPIPPPQLPENDARVIDSPNAPLTRPPLGFPTRPEELAIDKDGKPLRIDKAYSWDAPLAAHGAMHRVIANAVAGDPYRIDTLMLYMANMAWNSSMDTGAVQRMLKEKDASGEYKIPFLVVADAFHSETVNFADLVLPDTTYLERYDAISLLDRPISEPDAVADAIRHPVVPLDRDVRPFQEVLVELAARLGFPAFVTPEGARKYRDYPDFIIKYERAPGVGFLAGFRGANGDQPLRGDPNPKQWQAYIDNGAFFTHHWNDSQKYYRFVNRDYQEAALKAGFILKVEPIVLQIYSEPLQKFRNTGKVNATAFDPLPTWYEVTDPSYPFVAITQRPMMMYHSWDSQNAWLRQLLSQNFIYMNEGRAAELGFVDLEEVWVESRLGRIRARLKTMQGLEAGTVWTWNAVAKQAGAWGLAPDASEFKTSFLLNHLIPEKSDPVTGQAAWFDLGVKIYR